MTETYHTEIVAVNPGYKVILIREVTFMTHQITIVLAATSSLKVAEGICEHVNDSDYSCRKALFNDLIAYIKDSN